MWRLNGWFETGACRDVTIRRNRFINALTNMFQFTNAIISIYPEIPNLKDQQKYFHGGKDGGIVIGGTMNWIHLMHRFFMRSQ